MKPKLIIFDNDGVLVDSEIIWHKVNAMEMTRLGFPITIEKSIELFAGLPLNDLDKVMLREYGKTISDADVTTIIKKTEESYPSDLKSVMNISKVLNNLKEEHINHCVASNGDAAYIMMTLAITKLDNFFKSDYLFGVETVNKRKPAPDLFLNAANHFRVDPKDCLVIEDHALGIEAAKAANMPVIGFLGASHARTPQYRQYILKANPTIIVDNALELLDILVRASRWK